MDIRVVVQQIVVLFLLMGVGVIATQKGMIDATGRKTLSGLVVNVGLSGLVVSSVLSGPRMGTSVVLTTILLSALCYIPSVLSALAFTRLPGLSTKQKGVYAYMLLLGNTGFMGFPVCRAIFGEAGMFYASLANIPFFLFTYSVGVVVLAKTAGKESKINVPKLLLTSLPLLCAVASVVLYLANVPAPAMILNAAGLLGDMCTPLSMIVIGSTLSTVPVREIIGDYKPFLMSVIRLLLLPMLMVTVFKAMGLDPLMRSVVVLINAMPVAANCTMMCLQYGSDEKLGARGVFISTLLSVVSIPILVSMF